MMRFQFTESSAYCNTQYDLELRDDGTFSWNEADSYDGGAGGNRSTRGTWKRSGDRIELAIVDTEPPGNRRTLPAATLRADRLDVEGLGEFWIPRT